MMSELRIRKIWFIDDNEDELMTHKSLLASELPSSVEIIDISVRPRIGDYPDILSDEDTVAVLIDQRLKVTGVANYTGIELAQSFRAINDKLPILIITNFSDAPDEFVEGEWSVEYIISKSDMVDESKRRILLARLLRHIDIYEGITVGRSNRLSFLLRKSLDSELAKEEIDELDELKFMMSSPGLASELAILSSLTELLDQQDRLTSSIMQNGEDEDQ